MDGRGWSSDTRGRLGWLGILVPLGLGFVLSVGLAWQTWDAARRHRDTAEATVRDHAAFAAHLLASRVDRRMSQAMLYAFYYVDLAIRSGERWPGVEVLRAAQEIRRCRAVTPAEERVFFRWADGELDLTGPAAAGLDDWLRAWLPAVADDPPEERSFGLRFGAPGIGASGVAYRVFEEDEGVAVFGLDNCFREPAGDLFEASVGEAGVLPPTLVGEASNDSLFAVTALNGAGERVWGGPVDPRGYGAVSPVRPAAAYGGLSLVLRLRDETAERLVIGGLPRSRLPEALALVVLTGLLLAIAARQLRRGQDLVRLREQFVANISHELRTPLQQILLFSDLLRLGRVSSKGEREQAVAVIHRETRRLINLVENVLTFSRPATPSARARVEDTGLRELASAVVESFRPIADERDVRLEVVGEEVVARADAEALQRVLLNLLDNAIKYGPDGQKVRIRVARRDGHAVIDVEDEGPGVPPDVRDRIWEPYFRLGREEGRGRAGQGVGLAIARDLVDRMGGTIRLFDRDRGAGARFEIELPGASSGSRPPVRG